MAGQPDFQRPYGVILAEQRAAEARVLEEQSARELRLVLEVGGMDAIRERLTSPGCQHDTLSVRRVVRDLSDHETAYGQCLTCQAWIRRETSFSRADDDSAIDDRPMTRQEIERVQALGSVA